MTEETVPTETQEENTAATEAASTTNEGDELATARAEIAALKDQLLRQMAETENMRRRLEKDKQDASVYAVTSFARDVVGIADNLRRALDAVPESARSDQSIANVLTGIEMTEREIFNVFNKYGIAQVEALGAKLDPNRHQAMLEVPTNDAEPGTVVQVLQTGYVIKDRLLRPALVAVAKAAAPAASADENPGSRVDTSA